MITVPAYFNDDLGGGTFDISVLRVENELFAKFTVPAVNGNHDLGGSDFDGAIRDYALGDFQNRHAIDLRQQDPTDPAVRQAMQMLTQPANGSKWNSQTPKKRIWICPTSMERSGPQAADRPETRPPILNSSRVLPSQYKIIDGSGGQNKYIDAEEERDILGKAEDLEIWR